VTGGGGQIYPSPALSRVLVLAEDEAKALGDEYVSGEHFLLALFHGQLKGSSAGTALRDSGLTREKLVQGIKSTRGNSRIQDPEPEGKYKALEKYCRDLTHLARDQKP